MVIFLVRKKELFGGTIRFKVLIKELNENLKKLSALTIKMMEEGISSLLEDDELLLEKLIADLETVHDYTADLEKSVISSIALHQPFAKNLRYIICSLKISNEIHRSAHDAVHIARSSKFIGNDLQPKLIKKIGKLATKSLTMLRKSVDAFISMQALPVDNWVKLDDEVDNFHDELIEEITQLMMDDKKRIRSGISLILTTRYIERIADHACNIVEESIYVVTSKRVKID
ncbi:MAG: phosphate signaling complex protein PhoU [Candidatus Heimdallarchaeota archaeon]|nr:phosphate signaling complex protein PhoU [Candidatus Heimdallarchaeota archaeon]